MPARIRAFLIHLIASAAVIGALIVYTRFVWYPDALFALEDVTQALKVLFAVDVVLGPLLTLVVFKVGKPSLKFDLTVIVLLQVAALVYGSHVLWNARPVALVVNSGAVDVARAHELIGELPQWMEPRTAIGGSAVIYALPPENQEAMAEIALGNAPDVYLQADRYRPLAVHLPQVTPRGYDLAVMLGDDDFAAAWQAAGLAGRDDVTVLPLYGRVAVGSAVLDAEGELLATLSEDVRLIEGARPQRASPLAAETGAASNAADSSASDADTAESDATDDATSAP